ncbi:hypothetical protein E0Z10_g10990 [Xylaria hypoxylon]|uniref:Uncharacterized protein n=1 Tax=Xylaria hypoxylon TaxID=37992 RepID=A0A4Z0Y6E2_9PEZI|nr:hypothetical protein E0Z10_g10990 [Xylaria hypoxylon]
MQHLLKVKDRLLGRPKKNGDGPQGGGGVSSPSATSATDVISTPTTSTPASGPAEIPSVTTITALSTQPAASNVASPPSLDVDPWSQAYEIFQGREPELMEDYKKHLASLQDDAAAHADLSTAWSVECTMKQLLEDRDKKQWRVSLQGKDIKIREQAERLTKFLLWSDQIVKSALSVQPYAALAWSGVSLLLPLLTSGTTQNEAMLKGFNSIGDLQMYWRICEETYLRSNRRQYYQDLIKPLAELYSHIIEYQARVICHLSRAQLSRAWQNVGGGNDWDMKVKDIDDQSKRCKDHIDPLQQREIMERWNCQLHDMQQSRTILDDIRRTLDDGGRQTQRNYEDQQERDLLQDLASDYEGYKDFNPGRVEGTCEWFLNDDRFREWRDSSTSRLLWVSAGPGCGKSVLSRALIDEHRLSTNVMTSTVCYFFFKDGDEHRMHSTNALCAILHQLLTQDPSGNLIKDALPSHKSYGKALVQNFSELWRIMVRCAESPDTGEVVCILDALDECEKNSREQLIRKLKEFYCEQHNLSKSKLKFLITSRPYADLEASFRKFSTAASYWRFDGDDKSEQISQEINLVIDIKVKEIASCFADEDRRTISQRLKSMEHRTYLWLHLTFDIIEQSPSEYGRRSDVEELLSALPSQVSDAYEKILGRSKSQTQTEILLQIVLAAARPLTLDEANTALTLALDKKQSASHAKLKLQRWPRDNFQSVVKNLCGLFINVYDSKLSFIHQTAREFLTHPEGQGKWQGRLNMAKSHSAMSLVCLHYLLLPDLVLAQKSPDDQERSFLPYAAAHWPLHHLSQEDVIADQSRKDARRLCNVAGEQGRVWMPKYVDPRGLPLEGWTDLALASYMGLKLVVEDILVKEKTGINVQGGFYGTALQAASAEGHKEVVQMLLNKNADVDIQGGFYETALQAASVGGHKEVVQMLLNKNAKVDIQGGFFKTALQAALARGHKEVAQMLLNNNADVNIQGGHYETALQAASAKGHKEVI